jgi:hypothetical protein
MSFICKLSELEEKMQDKELAESLPWYDEFFAMDYYKENELWLIPNPTPVYYDFETFRGKCERYLLDGRSGIISDGYAGLLCLFYSEIDIILLQKKNKWHGPPIFKMTESIDGEQYVEVLARKDR